MSETHGSLIQSALDLAPDAPTTQWLPVNVSFLGQKWMRTVQAPSGGSRIAETYKSRLGGQAPLNPTHDDPNFTQFSTEYRCTAPPSAKDEDDQTEKADAEVEREGTVDGEPKA